MWLVPEKFWGDAETAAIIEPLNLSGEIEKFGRDLYFRAENGIPGAQESRRLGDVYKRQIRYISLRICLWYAQHARV